MGERELIPLVARPPTELHRTLVVDPPKFDPGHGISCAFNCNCILIFLNTQCNR